MTEPKVDPPRAWRRGPMMVDMTTRGSTGVPPDPGTGFVWVSPVEGEWYAIWDDADGGVPDSYRALAGPAGLTREQAIEWALAQPARGVKVLDGDAFVPVRRP